MNITVDKKQDGRVFISLTDFAKEYSKKYNRIYNLSASLKSFPKKYIIKKRGRSGNTFIDSSFLDFYLNSRRNIPKDFIDKFMDSVNLKISKSSYYSNMESFFLDTLIGFLSNMLNGLSFTKQFALDDKIYDLSISNKILIEFDEPQHTYNKSVNENDLIKNSIANNNNYILIRVNSNSNFGYEISNIYKKVKELLY